MKNIYVCPKCGYLAKDQHDDLITKYGGKGECPKCGIIVTNYLNKKNNKTKDYADSNINTDNEESISLTERIKIFFHDNSFSFVNFILIKKRYLFSKNLKKNFDDDKEIFLYLNNFLHSIEHRNIKYITYILLPVIFFFLLLIFNNILIALPATIFSYLIINKVNSNNIIFPKNNRQIAVVALLPVCIKIALNDNFININNKLIIEDLLSETNELRGKFNNYEVKFNQSNDIYGIDDYISIFNKIILSIGVDDKFRLELIEILFLINKNNGHVACFDSKLLELCNILFISNDVYSKLYGKYYSNPGDDSSNDRLKYFKILNCTENSTVEEIKKAYREESKKYHPDTLVSKKLPDELMKFCNDKFLEINLAYETLIKQYTEK